MALIKTLRTKSGVDYAYHRIAQVVLDFKGKRIAVHMESFVSKALRDTPGTEVFATWPIYLMDTPEKPNKPATTDFSDFLLALAAAGSPAQQGYGYLVQRVPDLQGAEPSDAEAALAQEAAMAVWAAPKG